MRDVGDLVAGQLHRVSGFTPGRLDDLPLFHHLALDLAEHLDVTDALFPHVIAVLFQQIADFVVQFIFSFQFIGNQVIDNFRDLVW